MGLRFSVRFLGIVGGYGLRRICSHYVRASCEFSYGPWEAGRDKAVQRLRGDCTEIVQFQCSCRAVSARKSYGARTASVQRLRGDGAVNVRCFWPQCPPKILRFLHDQRAASAQCPYGYYAMPPTTCLRATDLRFFQICITSR